MKYYLELFKIRIVFSVVLASIVGYVLASPDKILFSEIIWLSLVSFLCSSSSCVFNHVYEIGLDAKMERTKERPLPSGKIKGTFSVWMVCFGLMATGSFIALYFLNFWVFLHFFLGFMTYAVVYTVWLKPRTPWSIVWGGAAGSFALLGGACAASTGSAIHLAVIVALVFFFWTPPHYWSIALRYNDDYSKTNLPVLPLVIGKEKTAYFIFYSTILMFVVSLVPVFLGYFGLIYLILSCLAAFVFLYGNYKLISDPLSKAALNFRLSFVYMLLYFIGSVIDSYWMITVTESFIV